MNGQLVVTGDPNYEGPPGGGFYVLPASRWYNTIAYLVPIPPGLPPQQQEAYAEQLFEQFIDTPVSARDRRVYENYLRTNPNAQMEYYLPQGLRNPDALYGEMGAGALFYEGVHRANGNWVVEAGS